MRKLQLGQGPYLEVTNNTDDLRPVLSVAWMGQKRSARLDGWDMPTIYRIANELLAKIRMFFGIVSSTEEFACPKPA